MANNALKKEIALDLYDMGVLEFGEFTFKSGIKSPMYIDLRLFITHPKILKKAAKAYAKMIKPLKYDRLAGIAYAALPIAGAVSLEMEKPWIFMRKEGIAKGYGHKKAIEGTYNKGDVVVVIDDLITKGDSKLEVIQPFKKNGLKIKDFVVLIDYEKGGSALLKKKGFNLHAFMTMREVIDIMKSAKKIDDKKYQQCIDFLAS
ncbi:MAG TPA: orotate phosphoribosyltransferase [Patescibacteria group bacterium]|nr:orotate phosphoribosyltransferase [Patescibacteria group bacterium]